MEKSKNKLQEFLNSKYGVLIGVATIISLWSLTFLLYSIDSSDRGTFGDMFGAVNSLFSGLALGGITLSYFNKVNSPFKEKNSLIQEKSLRIKTFKPLFLIY